MYVCIAYYTYKHIEKRILDKKVESVNLQSFSVGQTRKFLAKLENVKVFFRNKVKYLFQIVFIAFWLKILSKNKTIENDKLRYAGVARSVYTSGLGLSMSAPGRVCPRRRPPACSCLSWSRRHRCCYCFRRHWYRQRALMHRCRMCSVSSSQRSQADHRPRRGDR